MKQDQQFYVGQKAFIEKLGKLLLLNDPVLGHDLPGGKIQLGETDLIASLKREVKEETGLEISVGQPFFTWLFVVPKDANHKNAGKKIYTVGYKCYYISGKLKLSTEHNNFEWIDKNSYQKIDHNWPGYKAIEIFFNT